MKRLFALLCLVLLCNPVFAASLGWHATVGEESSRTLVPGEPPLTVGQQNVFFNCLEFGLGVALTAPEQEDVRAALMQEYLSFKRGLLDDLRQLQGLWDTISVAKAEEKPQFRVVIRESLLEEARKNPDAQLSRVINGIVRGSEPIVPGTPRIAHRSLSSFLEIVQLALRLRDRRVVSWTPADREALETVLLKRLPQLSPDGRRWLSNADFHLALIDRAWRMTPPDEKDSVRSLLTETFAPAAPTGSPFPVDLEKIPLPPPNIFPLPTSIPWEFR